MKSIIKKVSCGVLSVAIVLAFFPAAALAEEGTESAGLYVSAQTCEDGTYCIVGLKSSYASMGLPAGINLKAPTVTISGDTATLTVTTGKGQFDRMLLKRRSKITSEDEGIEGTPIYSDPTKQVYDPVTKTGIDGYTFSITITKSEFIEGEGVVPAANVDAGIPFVLRYRKDYVNNNGESTYANQWSGSKDQYLGFEGLMPDIAACNVSLSKLVYNGASQIPSVTVRDSKLIELVEGVDYTIEYPETSVNAGNYPVKIVGIGAWAGTKNVSYKISKANQTLKLKNTKKKLKAKNLKKQSKTVAPVVVKGTVIGKLSFKKVSVNKNSKKFSINSKTGKVKVKKGTKKGTYKIRIKVKASGDANRNAASKTVVATIKIS